MLTNGTTQDAFQVSLQSMSTRSLWSSGAKLIQSHLISAVYLSLFGMAMPIIAFYLYGIVRSEETLASFNGLPQTGPYGQAPEFTYYFKTLFGFVTQMLPPFLGVLFIVFSAFYAFLYSLRSYLWGAPSPAIRQGWTPGMIAASRSALVLCGAALLFLGLAQFFLLPGLALLLLLMMSPIQMVWENSGIWRAMFRSLTLQYSPQSSGSQWRSFFYVFGLGLSGIMTFMALSWVFRQLLWIDDVLDIPRLSHVITWGDMTFRLHWFIVSFFKAWAMSLSVLFFACFMVAAYYLARQPLSEVTSLKGPPQPMPPA